MLRSSPGPSRRFPVRGAPTRHPRWWRTDQGDAVQDAPYLFRFRILGHGASNPTEAYILFGE